MKYIVLGLIKIYQKTFSPDHGVIRKIIPVKVCRFTPTCSQYGYQSIKKYGILRGGWNVFKRVLRCNPFNKGGHDPVK